MYAQKFIILLSTVFVAGSLIRTGPVCENSWTAYKDELCIKSFTLLQSYDEAKQFCSSQGDETSKASMVIVEEPELQNFLTSYINGTFDHIWLGGRSNNNTAQFQWEDGGALAYTNWQEGHPKNITNSDTCIEIRPIGGKRSKIGEGQWADVPCQKRNLVLCQKSLSWSIGDAVAEIIKIRKELNDNKKELEEVSSKVVPVGSIYIEYFNQPSPASLWPGLTWKDITNTYAGLFFRAYGGDSEGWGTTQSECAPRITAANVNGPYNHVYYDESVAIPASGWSKYFTSGRRYGGTGNLLEYGIRFNTEHCETRPKNKAIRIWKRTN